MPLSSRNCFIDVARRTSEYCAGQRGVPCLFLPEFRPQPGCLPGRTRCVLSRHAGCLGETGTVRARTLLLMSTLLSAGVAHAGPQNGNVVGGSANISAGGHTTTVTQSTP